MKKYCKHCIYESLPHRMVTFAPQAILFLEGAPLTHVYRITDGLVKINRVHPSGDEKIFDVLGPNDYVALLAVLQNKREYVASAVALTSVTAIQITYEDVLTAYQSNNVFQATCLHCAVTRSTMFQNQLFQTTNIDTEEKILATLQLLANKFGKIENGVVTMNLPITKTDLAGIIGIRRETLSRKLTEMQQNNIIKIEKNTYKFDRL